MRLVLLGKGPLGVPGNDMTEFPWFLGASNSHGRPASRAGTDSLLGEQMDSSAEDGGGPPTALARGSTSQDSAPQDSAPQDSAPQDSAPQIPGSPSPVVPEQRTAARRGPVPAGPPAHPPATHPPAAHPPATYPPGTHRPTDGVAVAAFVSGLVPAIPVTLVLGPMALIRIGRSGARGRVLAITGLVLAGLWTVAAALVAAAIITRPPPPKPVTLPAVFSLRAGECLNSGPNGISGLQVLSCTQAHDAEVFATFRVAGSHYPGPTALQQQARQGCAGRLAGYLNPELSAASLAQSFVYPDAGAWSAGERTVVCTVHSTSGPLVGSVRSAPG
jgi:Septum formation